MGGQPRGISRVDADINTPRVTNGTQVGAVPGGFVKADCEHVPWVHACS